MACEKPECPVCPCPNEVSEKKKNPHATCDYPPKCPCCIKQKTGVTCCKPFGQVGRVGYSLPQKPEFAIDHKEPIVVKWPPEQGQGDAGEDTGMREDLLCKIPNQIVPQVVTVAGTPTPVLKPCGAGEEEVPIRLAECSHPVCPDGQFHMEINPPKPIKTEIKIPDLGCAVRQPMRQWKQCVENTLINDRVRRPMARWCHKRRLPPLVIPTKEYERLKCKITENERKRAEKEARIKSRECQRLESRKRMSKWKYTVESVLDKKKAEEEKQAEEERESFKKLLIDIKTSRDKDAEEKTARANKLKLYKKGLIQDLHSAMAFSKMMQDIELSRQINEQDEECDRSLPLCEQNCMSKMVKEIQRPELADMSEKKPKKINEKLQGICNAIHCRQKEQEEEIKCKATDVKKTYINNWPKLPENYVKYKKDAECKDNSRDCKFKLRREAFNDELDDKLAIDAYVEAHEKEVERQACEYSIFLQNKDFIKKQTEERLIKEKVQYNIERAEKAGAVLVAMRAKKKAESNDYDDLKEKWERENQEKEDEKKACKEKVIEIVVNDFKCRKGKEKAKEKLRDATQQWCRERQVAQENYERECDGKSIRRQKAEEVKLYNLALASEKKCQQEREKYIENCWAEKIKGEYFAEMQEMKDYAKECINEWAGKGRSDIPMKMAMKKWEYDSQMDPRMFREYEKKQAAKKKGDRGGGDADFSFAQVVINPKSVNPNICAKTTLQTADSTTQSTTRRLGFC